MIDGTESNVLPETEFVSVNQPTTENVVVKIEPMQFLDEVCLLSLLITLLRMTVEFHSVEFHSVEFHSVEFHSVACLFGWNILTYFM